MIIKRLKELRLAADITQLELALKLNISREAYSLYETGRRQVSNEMLCKIADFYNVSLDYLFGRTDIPEISSYAEDERQLLNAYRKLDNRGKDNVRYMASYEYSRLTRQKNKTEKNPS